VVLLPSLVLGSQIEGTGVLQVWREDNRLVTSLTGKLNTKVPGIEGDKDEIEILGRQVFSGKRVESRDSISKGTRVSDMFPSESCQARCGRRFVSKLKLEGSGICT
jgi:hypothetical protein